MSLQIIEWNIIHVARQFIYHSYFRLVSPFPNAHKACNLLGRSDSLREKLLVKFPMDSTSLIT